AEHTLTSPPHPSKPRYLLRSRKEHHAHNLTEKLTKPDSVQTNTSPKLKRELARGKALGAPFLSLFVMSSWLAASIEFLVDICVIALADYEVANLDLIKFVDDTVLSDIDAECVFVYLTRVGRTRISGQFEH